MGWDGLGWDGMGWAGLGWDGRGWEGGGEEGRGWYGRESAGIEEEQRAKERVEQPSRAHSSTDGLTYPPPPPHVHRVSKDFRTCECPSVYPLPASTPGFEQEYEAASSSLPTHVHKTSCGGDWWQLGTYTAGAPKQLGSFKATDSWTDVFAQKKIDQGGFYASKDNSYPTKDGSTRRINWGWAQVPPASTQTLPREVTFNAAARQLQQYPIEEVKSLRGTAAKSLKDVNVGANATVALKVASGVAKTSEIVAVFELPAEAATFGVAVGADGAAPTCLVNWPGTSAAFAKGAAYVEVSVSCNGKGDTLRVLSTEKTVEVRIFSDMTMIEAFFQQGRVAYTGGLALNDSSDYALHSTAALVAASVDVYPMGSIWVSEDDVRNAPRVYQ